MSGGRFDSGWELSISTTLSLAAVVLLVLANGFFVATEFSLVSVRRTRIQQLAAGGDRRARRTLDRLDHLDTYIAATQLGITLASLALGWIGEPALSHLIEPGIERLPIGSEGTRETLAHTGGFAIAFATITVLHIVFGELAPKSLALQRPDATSLWVAGPIHGFLILFRPVIYALNAVGNAVVRLFGIEPAAGHTLVQSAEELQLSIAASRAAGLVDQDAHDLVDRAFAFTDLEASHVMVPRTEMTAVRVGASLVDVLLVAGDSGRTRLPVYEDDIDHIIGVLNIKRLLRLMADSIESREDGRDFDLRAFMSEPMMVPESARAADVLGRLRASQMQMALVIDEYGGTAGVVTVEDLVESLVGEIRDELEQTEPAAVVSPDGSVVIDGLTGLAEAEELHGLVRDDGVDVETVGGYVFAALGRPAVIGDEVRAFNGRILRVEALDGLRVARVRLMPPGSDLVPEGVPAELGTSSAEGLPS